MVQIGLGCNRNCKISQFTLFHDPRLLPFFSNPFELGVRKNIGQRRIGGRSDEVRGLRLGGRARKSGSPLGIQRARASRPAAAPLPARGGKPMVVLIFFSYRLAIFFFANVERPVLGCIEAELCK